MSGMTQDELEMSEEISALIEQRNKLLAASKLVLKCFSYAPNKGPAWYEATRIAVAEVEESL